MNWTLVILILVGLVLVNLPLILISRWLRKSKETRECQSCQHFISCAMASVTECPFLNNEK